MSWFVLEYSMRRIFFHLISVALLVLPSVPGHGAEPAQREPYGIGLEGFAYPYPVSMLPLVVVHSQFEP